MALWVTGFSLSSFVASRPQDDRARCAQDDIRVFRLAETRIAMPTRFAPRITREILSANDATLATVMIGKTESTTYRSVISSPEAETTFNQSGGRGVTPRSPKSGMANITTYVSA